MVLQTGKTNSLLRRTHTPELHNVGSTGQAKTTALQVEATTNPNITATLSRPAVRTFVQHPSLGR